MPNVANVDRSLTAHFETPGSLAMPQSRERGSGDNESLHPKSQWRNLACYDWRQQQSLVYRQLSKKKG